ncbi:hypothetical protein IEQ34_003245 [Dendrobium chrysotoxum]|uniref:Uncharacterized protein n=1 Tax=Dendrobium chrysotoxum TaxID=161865 RepID=A0AAV7HK31_DENCH|nr:hypothetical protein IEQ34_003245 [Dendrobium chrysotoxum]
MSGDRLPSSDPSAERKPAALLELNGGPIRGRGSDRAGLPPPGYLTVSETSLQAGLHFPPPAELVEILKRCGVSLSQFSYRAIDMQGSMTFRSKWLDMRTRDPAKCWSSAFFFMKNDWGLLEK